MEIRTDKDEIEWMFGKRRYNATFDEFAEANELDNGFFANSINLDEEEIISEEQRRQFYEPGEQNISVGESRGLKHHPAAINKIARLTFMLKGGDRGKIRFKYWNVIHHIMYSQKFDVVTFTMNQLAILKHDMTTNLYFAPYIMSLILQKTRFNGECRVQHEPFRPFLNDREFHIRALTPFPPIGGAEAGHGQDHGHGHDEHMGGANIPHVEPEAHGWVPPAGYFDPYFQGIQNSWNTSFAQFGQNM